MILGITGGSGCGKTTALKAVQDLGGLVLDCDAIYHELLACSPALLAAIGGAVCILFRPLGFGDWQSTVATVT